jgi:hypothetical protein
MDYCLQADTCLIVGILDHLMVFWEEFLCCINGLVASQTKYLAKLSPSLVNVILLFAILVRYWPSSIILVS